MMKGLYKIVLLGVAAAGVTLGGCAEPDDINRVQPDLIDKGTLTGEWHMLSTITRSPYASHYVFPGNQGTLERGVWEIEKDHLYFYRTYEFVEGVESQGIKGDTDSPLLDENGQPVTYERQRPDGTTETVTRYVYRSNPLHRFAISGHYDVRRTYNALTGEPSNVIVEDSDEKYWYERGHMRVDFGTDSASNYGDLQFGTENVTIYEGQEGPDGIGLRIQDDGTYIDYVVRGFIEAPRVWYGAYGWVPTCLFYPSYTGSYYECDEEEIHIRVSYKKVPEQNSYKPLNYDDHMLNKFGFYRSSRARHDELFGRTFDDALRHIRRFRIWEEYIEGADGKLDYAQMTPKPIVYYLSTDFPRELVPGAIDLANQWDLPFKDVVEARMGKDYNGRMYVLCENNNAEVDALPDGALKAETDPTYCKDMDRPKLLGDLRYNMLVSINDPVQYGLYGYGPMHSDPITGETVHANAFQYTANMRLGARTAVDMIEYAAGVQTFRDITQARHIETSLKSKRLLGTEGDPRNARSISTIREAQVLAGLVVSPEVDASLGSLSLPSTDSDIAAARMNRLLDSNDLDHLWVNADMATVVGVPLTDLDELPENDATFLRGIAHPAHLGSERVIKQQFEEDMVRGRDAICMKEHFDDSFRGLALELKDTYDDAMCTQLKADMDEGADYVFDFDAFNELGADCSADAGICGQRESKNGRQTSTCQFVDQGDFTGSYCMIPCSAGALLDQLRDEIRRVNEISDFVYWDPNALYTNTKDERVMASQAAARKIVEDKREEVFLQIYDRIWSTVAMHEVGHNVGLRHNFASSTDALNYFPTYWDIKGTESGGEWAPHRVFDVDTESQTVNRMREYQQTSIMEYTGAFNARWQGLGSYDRAAILFGYGEMVEVFESAPAYDDWKPYLADPSDEDPDQYSLQQRREAPLARALRKVHHTKYPGMFGGVANLLDRKLVDAHDIADLSKPCHREDDPYDDSVCGGGGSFCQPFTTGFFCTKPDMVEVPYRFCSDEYNWTQTSCQTWDEGADTFEIVRNAHADYESYWPFRAYKRDNALFSPSRSYWNGVMYFMYTNRKHFEHWLYDYNRFNKGDWWEQRFGMPWHEDINGGLGSTLAALEIFEYLANIFGRPNDAYYGFNEQRKMYEPIIDNGRNSYCNVFPIREDQGARPMYASYDFSGYIYTPYRAGTFYDRLAALMFMTYPTSMFTVGVDKAYDLRRFRMNFASVWPERMQNILTGMLIGEPDLFGWCIEHDGDEPVDSCSSDPTRVKPRMWFGNEQELDSYYANCTPLNPEPEYDFPTTQYRLPALAAVYGYGWMSYTFDRTFVDRGRIWLKGDGTDIAINPDFETIEYADPFSGKTYVASYDPAEEDPYMPIDARSSVPEGNVGMHRNVYWPSARLLALANSEVDRYEGNLSLLSSEYQYSTLQQTVGRLEILRGLYRSFDFGF